MPFLKGNTVNLGRKHSEIVRKHMSEARKGHKTSEETKKKQSNIKKGKKLTDEHVLNIKKSLLGNKRCLGNKATIETRIKMSNSHKGSKSSLWKGGITDENTKIRSSIELKLWREAVFARDGYTCQKCNKKGINLHSHHILNFSSHKELRFAIDNGVCLCKDCHIEFHNIYGRHNNTIQQIDEFINK